MLFMQLDHGTILRKETGHETPKMIRWIVAKPEVIQTGSGRLVPGSRHLVRKSTTDEMRVSRYLSGGVTSGSRVIHSQSSEHDA
jgi:hypothetical protein